MSLLSFQASILTGVGGGGEQIDTEELMIILKVLVLKWYNS